MKKIIIIGIIVGLIGIGVVVGMPSENNSPVDETTDIQVDETTDIQPVETLENNSEGGRNISLELVDSVIMAEP
jgi:hypothetical protein